MKKQITTLKNLVKFFGYSKGLKLFFLRYLNRKKYYQKLTSEMKIDLKDSLLQFEKQLLVLPVNKIEQSSRNIWFLWYQGTKHAPQIVKDNIKQLKKITQNSDFKIVELNRDNLLDYLDVPKYILDKVEKKKITLTHFSDIIRTGLLSKYGGIWLDSTCYVTDNKFDEIEKYAFYTQKYMPGRSKFFNEGKWSTFFMASGKGNPLETFLYNMFLSYFKKYDVIVDYFLLDTFIEIGYQNYDVVREMIDNVPYNNSDVMKLTKNSNAIKLLRKDQFGDTWIYKLNWRLPIQD